MKNKKTFIGIIVLITIIGLSFSACDEEGGSGGDTATFTMPGNDQGGGTYAYRLRNYSTSQVSVTIGGQSKTMTPYASLTGIYSQVEFLNSSSSATVSYSPAKNVRHEKSGWFYDFYNK